MFGYGYGNWRGAGGRMPRGPPPMGMPSPFAFAPQAGLVPGRGGAFNMPFAAMPAGPAAAPGGEPSPISPREADAVIRAAGGTRVKKLGEGGFGTVYLVRKTDDRLYACKIVRDPRMHGREVAEARLARDVLGNDHEKIIRVATVVRAAPGLHGILFDYVDGGSVEDVCKKYFQRRERLPEGFLWWCLNQMAEALMFCHKGLRLPDYMRSRSWQAPVIHGDVTPDNILLRLSPRGRGTYPALVLCDFGISVCVDDPDYTPQVFAGKDGFIAPEFRCTPATDMWALGATIHFGALGATPDKRPGASLRPRYSATLARVVHRLLARRPRERFRAEELMDTMADDRVHDAINSDKTPLAPWSCGQR